jgi:sulfatase maturation enzyme AslB (radical SAM superfamily)
MTTTYSALDYWFSLVNSDKRDETYIQEMYNALAVETPPILSVVGERVCNLSCSHCIFQDERASSAMSRASGLGNAVATIVRQMGPDPIIVHEGRIFRPWHLEWLKAIRDIRKDALVGMIDNGTYLKSRGEILASDFRFNWLDISIDGPADVHNRQRRSRDAFDVAIRGIKAAPEFLGRDGRVTSLFTLTSLNCDSILATSRILPAEIIEWHITTLSPARPEIAALAVSEEEFAHAWREVVSVAKERKLFFRIYTNTDLMKLAHAVGMSAFAEAFSNADISDVAAIFTLEGVTVVYYPTSVVSGEEVILDADAHHRLPYSIAYTLDELRANRSRFGEDLSKYTVGPVRAGSDLRVMTRESAWQWEREFGRAALAKEIAMFHEIYNERR